MGAVWSQGSLDLSEHTKAPNGTSVPSCPRPKEYSRRRSGSTTEVKDTAVWRVGGRG